MKNHQMYQGKRLSDGKMIEGHLIVWEKFCRAIIVNPSCSNVSDGDSVDYFSLIECQSDISNLATTPIKERKQK